MKIGFSKATFNNLKDNTFKLNIIKIWIKVITISVFLLCSSVKTIKKRFAIIKFIPILSYSEN